MENQKSENKRCQFIEEWGEAEGKKSVKPKDEQNKCSEWIEE